MTYTVVFCDKVTGQEISYVGDCYEQAKKVVDSHTSSKEQAAVHAVDEIKYHNFDKVKHFTYIRC